MPFQFLPSQIFLSKSLKLSSHKDKTMMHHSTFSRYKSHPSVINKQLYSQKNVQIGDELVLAESPNSTDQPLATSTINQNILSCFPNVPTTPPKPVTSSSRVQISRKLGKEAHLIIQIVLEILAFTYGIDFFELEVALIEDSSLGDFKMVTNPEGRRSLLTHDDNVMTCHLGNIASRVCSIIDRTQSCRFEHDGPKLLHQILRPAKDIGIESGYLLEKVIEYRAHRCDLAKRKESLLYKDTTSFSLFGHDVFSKKWTTEKQHRMLAQRLISDRIAIRVIAPTEEAKNLIENAITNFANKHCKADMRNIDNRIYADALTTAVAETIWNAWVSSAEKRKESDSGAMRVLHSGGSKSGTLRYQTIPETSSTSDDEDTSAKSTNGSVSQVSKTPTLSTDKEAFVGTESGSSRKIKRLSHGNLREMAREKGLKAGALRRARSLTENGGDYAREFWSGY
ncbi:hypothetical protein GQ44DRAFT_700205 [Phaeosphaeriaceae sp. PMI808]|nr:hypothetical protein GQ44DRAFT_700205 [Phaeosphaeriaceae sp. PMI808]